MNEHPVKHAFILAAGFGTRLKPLTDDLPKALVPYKGRPMIENVIDKLLSYGIEKIAVNTHHYSDKMKDYFADRCGKPEIEIICEKEILGTGGALKNAELYLSDAEDVLIYNTDVDCEIDLDEFYSFHFASKGIASLCVQTRNTSRYLLCNSNGKLVGRTENGLDVVYASGSSSYVRKAFCGIHIVNRRLFPFLREKTGNFDIIPEYMRLVSTDKDIFTFDITGVRWKDLGIPQNL
ncbi:MAG TPA: sugar phosphate nucleotidyltransferase [Ignavibacteria bacterium]|nr:sugar phosphate nucleotidyltransferase [Ignavibacteria bacterium]